MGLGGWFMVVLEVPQQQKAPSSFRFFHPRFVCSKTSAGDDTALKFQELYHVSAEAALTTFIFQKFSEHMQKRPKIVRSPVQLVCFDP